MEQPTLNYTDHDLLIRIHTLLEITRQELTTFKESTNKEISKLWTEKGSKADIDDHELRLRAIEKRQWILSGGLVVIQIALRYWK